MFDPDLFGERRPQCGHEEFASFDDWCDALDAEHARLFREVSGFVGYGPDGVIAVTGRACWRDYYEEGATPYAALQSDMENWEE